MIENLISGLPLSNKTPISDEDKKILSDEVLRLARPVDEVAEVSGVYFLFYKSAIVYIGQSNSVYVRINTHFSEPFKTFDSFAIVPIKSYSERILRERQLINTFQPYYNITPLREQGYETLHNLGKEFGLPSEELNRIANKHETERYSYLYHVESLRNAIECEKMPIPIEQKLKTPNLFD